MLKQNVGIVVTGCFSFLQGHRSKSIQNVIITVWKDPVTATAPMNAPPSHSLLVCSQCELNIFLFLPRFNGKRFNFQPAYQYFDYCLIDFGFSACNLFDGMRSRLSEFLRLKSPSIQVE